MCLKLWNCINEEKSHALLKEKYINRTGKWIQLFEFKGPDDEDKRLYNVGKFCTLPHISGSFYIIRPFWNAS